VIVSAQIVVPQLGESVVEARIARWLKRPGDPVSAGEPVVELETDKIDLEVGAEQAGVLLEIARQEGEDVRVGEVLAVVGDAPAGAVVDEAPGSGAGGGAPRAPAAAMAAGAAAATAAGAAETAPEARADESAAAAAASVAAAAAGPARDRATPTARRMAAQHAIDLADVTGTGEGGRIVRRDVERHLAQAGAGTAAAGVSTRAARDAGAAPSPAARPIPAPPAGRPAGAPGERREERIRMSKRRLTIARNLVEAQRTAAMLTTFNEVDMGAVMALRERRKAAFRERYGVGLGIASFFVKASIAALRAFPRLNAEIQGEEMVLKHYYDIGIAVGAPQGLVVPVLRDADRMTFAEIELAIRDFARRASEGTLTLEDLRGGTFTITNGGVFGSLLSTPILNPPQVGILGLHKIEDRPAAVGGQVVVRPMMYIALTYDHRIVDGMEAVQFLVKVKEFVEDPGHLLLES
jgi:2-oxoglutarate dehydrogenase E2 component (dihydrolipoamide succinyltransferase)